jgi:putative ABC transport system substrate-binding protein
MHQSVASASRLWISPERLVVAIVLLALAVPIASPAQQSQMPRVGVLAEGSPDPSRPGTALQRFEDGLREHGYVPGTNVAIKIRFAERRLERSGELAAELLRSGVDVVVAFSERGAIAVKQVSTSVPIVMVLGVDPVRAGLIDTLARPGRNVTGLTVDPGPEIIAKRLQLLREIVPMARTIALLTESLPEGKTERFKPLEEAARTLGVSLINIEVRRTEELGNAFAAISKSGAGAILVSGASMLYFARHEVTRLTLRHRLPAIYPLRDYAEAGGLISYGVDFPDLSRRAAGYVARILKGAKPGDLPVEQPTKFELVVNLSTAKALGLPIPQSMLLRANEVIGR